MIGMEGLPQLLVIVVVVAGGGTPTAAPIPNS